MKKRSIKNYLKLGVYLFGIFIVILSCQKEPFDNFQEQAQEKRLKKISLNEFTSRVGETKDYEKLSKLFDTKKRSTTIFGRLEQTDNSWLITDEIAMIEKEGATFYTFRVGTEIESISFYNFVVVMDENSNILSTRILEYIPSNTWLQDTSQPFSGEVKTQENNIFSDADVDALFLARGSRQCITSASGAWECGYGNNHGPGECNASSFEYIITVKYGPCPAEFTIGEDDGYPIDTTSGSGGGSSGGTSNNNDDNCVPSIENPCDEDETTILTPRDNNEEDDCNTSKEDLKKIFPNMPDANAELLASIINDKGQDFGINSDEDLWHFLSQAGHETGGFNTLNVTENLNYSTASYIPKSYSKFTMDTIANPTKLYAGFYTGDPEKLANAAMCCKNGNGNEISGDGWKYRGRGIFQLTWKDNYTAFKTWYNDKYDPDIDTVTAPDLISTNDTLAVLSGLWYYKARVVDKITIDSTTAVLSVTKKINGGDNGLPDRKERFQKAKDSINCL